MKKVLLFLFLINLSLFAQSQEYIDELYYTIKYNDTAGISNSLNHISFFGRYDLNNIISKKRMLEFDWSSNLWDEQDIMSSEYDVMGDARGYEPNITPLGYAIHCGNIEAIDTLLKLGANIEKTTEYTEEYMTPLMIATRSDSTGKVVSFLINKGAKVNAKNRLGKTALMYAHSKEVIDLLIKNKANVNTKDNNGITALMYACMYHELSYDENQAHIAMVKSLIRAGANIDEIDNRGNNALLHAIHAYSDGAFDFSLLDGIYGMSEPEKVYENEFSVSANILELIKLLINNGANVNIRNKEGETPLSLSERFPKLTKLLRDNGAYLQ